MASFLAKITKGSHLNHDFSCTPCTDKEAQHFCEDCKKYFCDDCLRFHAVILQDHTLYGRQDVDKWGGGSEMCVTHDEDLAAFCEDHQEVCCSVCVDINHRSCGSVRQIDEVAKGIHMKPEYKRLPAIIAEIQAKLNTMKNYEKKHKQGVQDSGKQIRDEIKSLRKEINTLLDDIEKTTLEQLDANVADIVSEADDDIRKFAEAHDSLAMFNNLLPSAKREKSSFIQFHKCSHQMKRAERTIHKMSFQKVDKQLSFLPDNDLKKLICQIKMFGKVETKRAIKPYHIFKLVSKATFNVKLKKDESSCRIKGICELPNGELLILDINNYKLKLLAINYRLYTAHLSVPAEPVSVCNIVDNEVAVILNDPKKDKGEVHFFTITNVDIQLKRKFPLQYEGRSIVHNQGKLFVASDQAIYLHTMNGDLVKKIYEYTCGVNQMAISNDGKRMYLTTLSTGVLNTLDSTENEMSRFSDPQLMSPSGVHAIESGHVFVCGTESYTVLLLDGTGRLKLAMLAGRRDGVYFPLSVCFSLRTSSLIVGLFDGNEILVLKLE